MSMLKPPTSHVRVSAAVDECRARVCQPADGHKSPATTLKWYAKYIPGTGRRWVNLLDLSSGALADDSGTKKWNQGDSGASDALEAREKLGEPSGTRTRDPLIKSGGRW